MFEKQASGWAESAVLTPSDAQELQRFGNAVAASGGRVLVGAARDSEAAFRAGAAYVFTRQGSSWIQTAKLIASDAAEFDELGTAVALSGKTAALGTLRNPEVTLNAGSAYVFALQRGSWVELARLVSSDLDPFDRFGHSVAVSRGTVLLGAEGDDDGGSSAGAAYVFAAAPAGCSLSADVAELSLAAGGSQTLALDGGGAGAGRAYLVLGTASGLYPGTAAGGVLVPLEMDAYFGLTLAGTAGSAGFSGVLDPSGKATAQLALPAGSSPALVGTRLHHAFVLYEPALDFASNAVLLELVP